MRALQRRSVLAGIIALNCSMGACARSANDMVPLGGAWRMYLHSGFGEAGVRPSDIYRDWRGARVLVERNIEFHEYYSDPDCLLWETKSPDHVVSGACGEHQPMVIARDDYHRWTMDARGLVDEGDARVNASGAPVRPIVMVPLSAIAIASARQPPFSGGWVAARAPIDASLRPVEMDVPIEVNAGDQSRRTPLINAASARGTAADRLALVNALVAHGADVNAADTMGTTALMVASDGGHVDVIRRLIAAGAAVNAQASDGTTALMAAAGALDDTVACVTTLLEAGADKGMRDKYGHAAFDKIRTNTDPQLKVLLDVK